MLLKATWLTLSMMMPGRNMTSLVLMVMVPKWRNMVLMVMVEQQVGCRHRTVLDLLHAAPDNLCGLEETHRMHNMCEQRSWHLRAPPALRACTVLRNTD
jgi:hypothetical protein